MIQKEIKGCFDGQNMDAEDGNIYPIPANYASKSKLVDGDLLVLKITLDGSFIFKQINIHPRRRVIATIVADNDGKLVGRYDGILYKILDASLSYYKLKEGDKATLLLPLNKKTEWGTVEYAIK
jgi:hypothetical protein